MNTPIIIARRCGTDVSSRAVASKLRRDIVSLIEQHNCSVELDFSGVRTISDSFADELLGVLAGRYGSEWFRTWISVTGLDELPRETVLEAIQNRLEPTH